MTTLIIYDSTYGNTEKIAKAIANGISGKVQVVKAGDANAEQITAANLLIVGSPTQGGRPTPVLQKILGGLPAGALKNVSVATFDTRFAEKDQNFALRLLIKTVGYAGEKIAKSLESAGGTLVILPEGFIVSGKEGPLKQGELERATAWARGFIEPLANNQTLAAQGKGDRIQ